MLVAILILIGCGIAIAYSIFESEPFFAFIGIIIVGVIGLLLFVISSVLYYPNQHTSTYKLEKLSTGSYVQIADDTYTFKIDDEIIVKSKDELDITILNENGTPKANVTKDPGGFNQIGYEFVYESYELKIPSDTVSKVS